MLLQFTTSNYKTFKSKATLSLVASNYDQDSREGENVLLLEKFGVRTLKSAVVYGANASGKSKLFDALRFMRSFALHSSKETLKGEPIEVVPFLLDTESESAPSEFEVVFVYKTVMYRYGFEVNQQRVISEWLFYKPNTKEVQLYYRDENDIEIHERKFAKGRRLVREGFLRENALLLSLAAQFNEETAVAVLEWFANIRILSGLREELTGGYSVKKSTSDVYKPRILELLRAADTGIHDISVQKIDVENLSDELPKNIREQLNKQLLEESAEYVSLQAAHAKYNSLGEAVASVHFSFDEHESEGTKKFFALTGPMLDALENGHLLVVDELDAKLHSNLVDAIVALFNSNAFNPKGAQLLFNTHNTSLLNSSTLRRDQFWFTEKDRYGAATLYALADFKSSKVRKNQPMEEKYRAGKFGAVPLVDFTNPLT